MAIVASEIKRYKSSVLDDSNSNGGVMTSNLVLEVRNGLFPDVYESERISGIERWRKLFIKMENDDDIEASLVRFFFKNPSPGDDYFFFIESDDEMTQGDIVGSERRYGSSTLASDVASGATSFDVILENSSINIFDTVNTNLIWVGDDNNSEFHAGVTVAVSGATATITLAAGDSLNAPYNVADNAYVSSVLEKTSVKGRYSDFVVSSTAGTYDDSLYPVLIDSIGGIYDNWTLTFISATEFNCSGALSGSVGSGQVVSDFAPTNANFLKPYFTLRSAGFGGTFQTGDIITFKTYPAAFSVFIKQTVPAGANAVSDNIVTNVAWVQSA